MSQLKANILTVIKSAYNIGKKNDFKNTILENEEDCRRFIAEAYAQFKKLRINSDEIKILRLYCRYALEDCKAESYTKNIQNLLNEFYEIFSTKQIKKLSRVVRNF